MNLNVDSNKIDFLSMPVSNLASITWFASYFRAGYFNFAYDCEYDSTDIFNVIHQWDNAVNILLRLNSTNGDQIVQKRFPFGGEVDA